MKRTIPDTGSVVIVNVSDFKGLQGVKGIVTGYCGEIFYLQVRLLTGKEIYCSIDDVEVIGQ